VQFPKNGKQVPVFFGSTRGAGEVVERLAGPGALGRSSSLRLAQVVELAAGEVVELRLGRSSKRLGRSSN